MRFFAFFLGLGIISLSFQNCGELGAGQNAFLNSLDDETSSSCEGVNCFHNPEFLWVSIREYEPYRVNMNSLVGGHFMVGGQCGVGQFASHIFVWEYREGFGTQQVVGQGTEEDPCDVGIFQLPVVSNMGVSLQADQRYILDVHIQGYDQEGEVYSNPMPSGRASLEVLFELGGP
mgnify:FL=1